MGWPVAIPWLTIERTPSLLFSNVSPSPINLQGCSKLLLSLGCGWGRYYRVAHGTGPIPNGPQVPCRTRVACLVKIDKFQTTQF